MINIGFIGLGGMGMHQANSFAKVRGVRVVAGSDPAEAARARFNEKFPDGKTYASHRDLLADKQVDAVVVAPPTLYHKEASIDALRSGRPVMVEKPMARTVAGCHAMIKAAEKAGKLLMVAHCRRYDADWGVFGDLVQKGRLGSPILWRHCMAGFGPPRSWFLDHEMSGGPLMDGAIHDQDYANMLFGDPVEVMASSVKLTDVTCIETATAVIRYQSGSQLMLSWSWGAGGGAGMQDALGTKASVVFRPALEGKDIDLKTYTYYKLTDRKTRKETIVKRKRKDMYVEQAKHFIDCIDGKARCRTPGEVAIKAVASSVAILAAAPRGRVVKVKW